MVHSAADADASAQNLLDCAGQLACAATVAHDAGNLDDLIQFQVAAMLDILFLQASTTARSALGLPLFVGAPAFHGSICRALLLQHPAACQLAVLPPQLELNEATDIKLMMN